MTTSKELISSDVSQANDKNFSDVFAILIYLLHLKDIPEKGWRSLVKSAHSYSFEVSDAAKMMECLELFIELRLATTTIRYSIKTTLAMALLSKFFTAHLVHDPTSRTTSNLKSASKLQVTPKGAAIVFEFFKNIGMREDKMPPIVFSSINTMLLFHFDRSPNTGKVLNSEYLNHVLITHAMGPLPNVWRPDQRQASAKNLLLEESLYMGESTNNMMRDTPSPFHHRYFSNPQSDAHIQYYESSSGVRLFADRKFIHGNETTIVSYCFSGKALVQWLCDCTTLNSTGEAIDLCQLLLNQRLIIAVTVSLFSEAFYNHPDAIYTLTELGGQSCKWWNIESAVPPARTEIDLPDILLVDEKPGIKKRKVNLEFILSDPGLRFLFKLHLEKESCSDNYEAYLQLKEFIHRRRSCSRLLRHAIEAEPSKRRKCKIAIESFAASNTLMAFHIYSKYFSVLSVYNLNIGFGLQQELDSIIANIERSPISPTRALTHDITDFIKTPDVDHCFGYSEPDLDETGSENSDNANAGRTAVRDAQTLVVDLASKLTSEPMLDLGCKTLHANLKRVSFLSQDSSSLEESIEALTKIWRVFDKVAVAIYRMMESDLFAKFVRSPEYLNAVQALTE